MHHSPVSRWVRLTGHLEGHFSLAIVNRSLAGELEKQTGGQLQFVPHDEQPYSYLPRLPAEQEASLHDALRREVPADAVSSSLSIVQHYPFIADPLPSGVRGLLFFWEETAVSAAVVEHIHRHFDIVWVTASYVKRALINSGCRLPVLVVPIGIDHLIDDNDPPLGELAIQPQKRFRFLHVSSAFDRKGVDVLLAAYLNTFNADDPVELYIKTSPSPHSTLHARVADALQNRIQPALITIDEHALDNSGMKALYRSAQAMVLPTRGEGFNLPAAEALALGLPVITTGYGGQVDFCTSATALLVRFRFARSRSHVRSFDSCWLEPDPDHLAEQMRVLYHEVQSQAPALAARRAAGVRQVRTTYRWAYCARAILNSVDRLAEPAPRLREGLQLALISSWGCGSDIAQHAQHLLKPGVQSGQLRLSVYGDEHANGPDDMVVSSWQRGDSSSLYQLLERLPLTGCEVVFLQHHPALFNLSTGLCERLLALHDQGLMILLELHSTLPLLGECRPDEAALLALAQLDRIIVHDIEALNRLQALGLTDNVMLLPVAAGLCVEQQIPAHQPRWQDRQDWAALCQRLVGMMHGLRVDAEHRAVMKDNL